ncbi:MAG: hypothetical protein HYX99_03260 [Chloroflexi bacterium]|nr:hypothetical protein [Chloroflexota bacterium]
MDPAVITRDIWAGISDVMWSLWFLVPLVAVFGGSLLLSLAFIPSLRASGELPPWAERLRPPLYLAALIAFVALVVSLVVAVQALLVMGEFWPRWWI